MASSTFRTIAPSFNCPSNPVLTALGRYSQPYAAGCFRAASGRITPDPSITWLAYRRCKATRLNVSDGLRQVETVRTYLSERTCLAIVISEVCTVALGSRTLFHSCDLRPWLGKCCDSAVPRKGGGVRFEGAYAIWRSGNNTGYTKHRSSCLLGTFRTAKLRLAPLSGRFDQPCARKREMVSVSPLLLLLQE